MEEYKNILNDVKEFLPTKPVNNLKKKQSARSTNYMKATVAEK